MNELSHILIGSVISRLLARAAPLRPVIEIHQDGPAHQIHLKTVYRDHDVTVVRPVVADPRSERPLVFQADREADAFLRDLREAQDLIDQGGADGVHVQTGINYAHYHGSTAVDVEPQGQDDPLEA